ncbi:hypothetical protein J2Y48_004478 [Mycoplana sp. BE70]|uniref:BatD family protein n=1 Tax=Mycoplana sp. BE70 TaxID=2817775 RepID=UPI0028627FBA|nr:BatD family protein [Mycoplana sp. BE70]MDR6759162.1 hypothetical protein [Mycoplana sp. BE70]
MSIHRLSLVSLLAMLLGCFATTVVAQAADPVARARLQSQGTLYVGQEVLVDVDVLVPNYFLQPPQFPAINLPGAIVTLQDGRALNLNETIDGAEYSGIRRTYVITPQQSGDFSLPPAEITFGYAAVAGQTTQGKVTLPSLRFTVQVPPGSTQRGSDVVAAKIAVEQVFDRDPATLKAGDILVRTITVHAEGLRAMMIPEPDLSAPQGVRLYRQAPSLSEETDRSGVAVAGVRKDVASYLFADPGTYILPAVDLSWFDPSTATTRSASAPEVTVTVAAASALSNAIALPSANSEANRFNWIIGGFVAGAVAAGLVIGSLALGLSRFEVWWEGRRSRQQESEAMYFRHVEDAAHGGSTAELAQALDAWARKAGLTPLRSWLARHADADTIKAYDSYGQVRYGDSNQRLPREVRVALLEGLISCRRRWILAARIWPIGKPGTALPPLNP